MIVQFRNEKVSNHGSIPITIDCNVVAFIGFEEGFHQPIKRTKQQQNEAFSQSEASSFFMGKRVAVMDSWQSWHEFKPSAAEDPRVGERCTCNMSRA
ncbi:hypothetical protein TNCV_3395091 [Trichonephila clavipes]|nr:hypothetical protein TNCV_3395091 [Trichonephila clavipes]